MKISEVKKILSNLEIERRLTEERELKLIRDSISSWARKVPHHDLTDLGNLIEIKSAIVRPTYILKGDTQYEKRTLMQGTWPYKGKSIFQHVHLPNSKDIWSARVPVVDDFTDKVNRYTIEGSEKVARCDICGGEGRVACSSCNGFGRLVCNNCSGQGKVKCRRCGGRGRITCSSCGGRGTTSQYDSRYNTYINKTCLYCGGQGYPACSACYGTGYVNCEMCEGDGKITCHTCGGYGFLTCGNCEGSGQLLFCVFLESSFKHVPFLNYVHHSTIDSKVISKIKRSKDWGDVIAKFIARSIPEDIFSETNYAALKTLFTRIIRDAKGAQGMGVLNKDYRILRQKIIIRKLDIIDIDYSYSGKVYKIILFGKHSVWAPVSPLSEISDNLFKDAEKASQKRHYSEALEFIEKSLAIRRIKTHEKFKEEIISKIHRQYVIGGILGGAIFPIIGNLMGLIIGLIFSHIFSTSVKIARRRISFAFFAGMGVSIVMLIAILMIYI